ncbi:lysylphosphatidylglycerol synthase transmembrane domain-containing protein [Nocardioides marmoribigeumensis]|uniref:Uncharacterized membrane protein YbhN (UPF0104 family) n=1 Tax=Nocardioides marmoribigeumensis TaxID=433649 RepID=A0ABU2C0M3_9ACTN|nr:lysylphosphatidylglycerol synthase transmembrane domain-containing protein [Nocardioides marmoribigeumensis]MDR7364175.1 uncharacterized membrane protein YbhN (UPF0104 family) [Nocardioides marmoribigeumensis]
MSQALRLVTGAPVLAVLLAYVGTEPFARALDALTVPAVATALAVTALTTACCAWRWTWTARHLGLDLDLRSALGAYYRSQLLNVALPGGVLGDVHRAVRHGVDVSALPGAARAVLWERAVGQVLLVGGAAVAMAWLPAPARMPAYLGLGVALVVVLGLLGRAVLRVRRGRRSVAFGELRRLAVTGLWLPLVLSAVAVLGHVLVLLTAARAAGVALPAPAAVPLLLTVLLGSSLPLGVAGWGPREGTAAWVFSAAGLGAAGGVTVAALSGVLTFLAVLPGAVLLLADAMPRPVRWRHA